MTYTTPKSKCCKVEMLVSTSDEGTSCWICSECHLPTDPKETEPTPKEEWEKEFDKVYLYPGSEKIKYFIRTLLTAQKERLLKELNEEVKGMKKVKSFVKTEEMSNEAYKHYSGMVDGYNQAFSEVLELISKKI